jgi:hypothetical protein
MGQGPGLSPETVIRQMRISLVNGPSKSNTGDPAEGAKILLLEAGAPIIGEFGLPGEEDAHFIPLATPSRDGRVAAVAMTRLLRANCAGDQGYGRVSGGGYAMEAVFPGRSRWHGRQTAVWRR